MSLLIMYDDIVETIKALKKDDDTKLFNTVGFWNSQPLNESVQKAFNYPALFIHFESINWPPKVAAGGFQDPTTEEQQSNASTMTIHILHSHLQDVEESFRIYYPINEAVYFALQNKKTEDYGPLIRIAERQDVNHDRVIDWQMDFRFTVIQTGQSVNKTTVAADTLETVISGTT